MVDGGCVAMHQFCESLFLIPDTEIYHINIATNKHPFSSEAYAKQKTKFKKVESLFINTDLNLIDGIRTTLRNKSYNLTRFQSSDLINTIEDWISKYSIDLLIFDSLFAASVLEAHNFPIPCYIRAHNIEADLWQQKAKQGGIKGPIYRKLAETLAESEKTILEKSNGVIFISADDQKLLSKKKIQLNSIVIPVGIQTNSTPFTFEKNHFHFIGAMNWFPNQEAVHKLIKDIFPIIKSKNPKAELHLAGSYFPKEIKTNPSKGIYIHGFVENATAFRQNHGIQLMPIETGSGVRIKLLEALSEGVPIVATPMAVFGMDKTIEKCCKIEKNDIEFALTALELNENSEIRNLLTQNGRDFVQNHFSIESIAQQIATFIYT